MLAGGLQLTAPSETTKKMETSELLATLKAGHPRLILTDERLAALKEQAEKDDRLRQYVRDVISQADKYCGNTPAYQGGGRSGPDAIRARAYPLGLTWRWTEDQRYADQLKADLLGVCGEKDWGPYLTAAIGGRAVGISYDWLHEYLDPDTRRAIVEALMEKVIRPGLLGHQRGTWWTTTRKNWNHVCNGGMAIAALAVADEHPTEAEDVLNWVRKRVAMGIAEYEPDGPWPEGPGYWDLSTDSTVCLLDSLTTALGSDLGLSNSEGLSKTGAYLAYVTGPTGKVFNYSDLWASYDNPAPAFTYWLARRYDRPDLVDWVEKRMDGRAASPGHVLWYWRPARAAPFRGELDRIIKGAVDLAAFRSSWDDPNALFVCIKGGRNGGGHVNLDLGTFVMDALGVRWVTDLGGDSYSLPGYSTAWASNSPRWKYFRPSSHSHSIPTIDGKNQRLGAKAEIKRFRAGATPVVTIDLSSAYKKWADKVVRGLSLVGGRRAVLIQDELKLKGSYDLAWGLTTPAKITLDGSLATLTQQDRRLVAEVLSPRGASFIVESAQRKPPEARNDGISRLMIRLPAQSGNVRIAVLLRPVWQEGKPPAAPKLKPLLRW